ncbi:hypothetical protein I2494_11620 [Budviciaceae bacterium BWR-B9]|uniref:Lipoprotein n=1 Tax=Limnobaculum allomyrinae TaxID=2791986 RepID=A0ABS1IRI2_9GAMM|nr:MULTISPECIES: hypothetical protein [Limnobaculum]MBK5144359.1 hypothetical protein [Limnobaculum allomyrinae]MBV7691896.1 hypothetical protein [Limnobaculum sp. M2-1]
MKKFALLLLPALLSGCVASGPSSPTVEASTIVPNSIIHLDDKMNAMRKITLTNGQEHQLWFNYDCTDKKIWSLYRDQYQNGKLQQRYYGYGSGTLSSQYTAPVLIGGGAENPQQEADIAAICQIKSMKVDWITLSAANASDYRLLFDRKNSARKGDLLMARLGFQFSKNKYISAYNAPYSLTVEDHIFNCKTQEDTVVATFNVDKQNFITNADIGRPSITHDDAHPDATQKRLVSMCKVNDLTSYKNK